MTHRFTRPFPLAGTALIAAALFSTAFAAGGGNSENARVCQKGGWASLARTDGSRFEDAGDCTSYAAHGGNLVEPLDCDAAPAGTLASAIATAPADATLYVKGTCLGGFPLNIERNLSLIGTPAATLDGLGATTGKALRITTPGVSLTLNRVDVTRGIGGGILNQGGVVTLIDSSVYNNTPTHPVNATLGGGVVNGGQLILRGSSSIHHNSATAAGGGIFNNGIVVLSDNSSVHSNSSSSAGGVQNSAGASLTLNDAASVHGNSAVNGAGGIFGGGVTVLNGNSSIHSNTSNAGIGGIGVTPIGSLTLNGSSSVYGNTAVNGGGGIANSGVTRLNDSSRVHHNSAGAAGGGVLNDGSLTLSGSSGITDNTAGVFGGGIANFGAGVINVCSGWAGALLPNSPPGLPTLTPVTC